MSKFTPWFDAKLHSPAREGWYDCEECNARHYFKDGLWYRNKKSLRDGPMSIRKMHWRGLEKPSLKSLLAQCDPNLPRSKGEQEWLDMAPVGREFGSPDYDRLMEQDADELKKNLARLIKQCRDWPGGCKAPSDPSEHSVAVNVQLALRELGQDVSLVVAAAVWRHYSNSLRAVWMSGAETVSSAKKALLLHCLRRPKG